MKLSAQNYIAGGGLIDRRSLLSGSISFLAAGTIARVSSASEDSTTIADAYPAWSRTLGNSDSPYGRPSHREANVVRKLQLPAAPENSGSTAWLTPIESMHGAITPNGLHFGSHHFGVPDVDPATHELMIHGLVDKPLKFTVEHLLRYPMVSHIRFLECSGNTALNALAPFAGGESCQDLYGLVSCAEWVGVKVSDLLNEAGLKKQALWVIAEGADGGSHARSIPLSKMTDDAIIAFYQNGEKLRAEQGYPMRLLLPGWEGNTSVKYLHRLEISDRPAYTAHESGLYTEQLASGRIEGFSFPMDVKSVITHPSAGHVLDEKGFYEISGLAWSGYGSISSVEVSADEGKTWATASLHNPVNDKALTRFSIPWQWNGKSTILLSRATDDRGRSQPTRKFWKQKYTSPTFNHYNAIQPWHVDSSGRLTNVFI
ncbi:MAG: sulfite dehydrogenase [Gammaproteobacteria bacterium]|jgi:sulfane dehydrogenase subunit SoxC|nr:sulfite dehydrogenase [Gammaproteobacteria bacterium]MBT4494978.1 sulfite dehydrogenase [Gammaproteobacteria bacterium]MBT7371497.1 sulfite dehydrogenase [Gammaproteobacteria bacterium]